MFIATITNDKEFFLLRIFFFLIQSQQFQGRMFIVIIDNIGLFFLKLHNLNLNSKFSKDVLQN